MAIHASTADAIKQVSLDSPEAIEELKSNLEGSTPETQGAIASEIHEFISQALGSSPVQRWSPPRESGTLAHIADLMPLMPSAVVVQGLVVQLSMDQDGCRLLQSALETGDGAERAAMSMEFYGHVCDALESPHAHHVLQRIIELMPPSSVSFILHELQYKWTPTFVARHRFGCRVLERVIEHFPACPHAGAELAYFLEGILQDAAPHCYHSFSTFVMQHILEYGSTEQQRAIVSSLCSDLWRAALDMHAVGCLDKALSFQPFEDQVALASAILDSEGLLTRMALTRKGLPVARRLLRVIDGANLEQARRQLSGDAAKLARSKGGKALLSAAKLGDHAVTDASSDKSAVSNSNVVAPRQHLMLDSVIVSVPEMSALDQAQMSSVGDKNSSFFAGMKDVEPFVPVVHAPVMQPMMQPYVMAGWVMCQSEDGNVLVPGQQQMVQMPAGENNKAEPWWSSTVAEVTSSLWCNAAPEQASMMAD
jgi:hypothetical protein